MDCLAMSEAAAGSDEQRAGLTDEQRNMLTDELFRLHEIVNPGYGLCFCGGDSDLVHAVEDMRIQVQRERAEDEMGD